VVNNRQRNGLLAIGLIAITLIAYRQVGTFSFVLFDDPEYVTENAVVKSGLTGAGAAWAFSGFHVSNWHPVTWLSHMADVSLFGVDPGAHHLVNLFLHAANTLLLFLVLSGMTRSPWRSAFVAALFAVHPLHVESVAWISERKDVLSTLFLLLTLRAYAGYAKRGGTGRYLAVLLFFILGLLSKPMLVTLPFVLLLLDFWPLRRTPFELEDTAPAEGTAKASIRRLLLEKAPLALLAALFSLVTFLAQRSGGSVSPYPPGSRVANAVFSYAAYLGKTAWPDALAMFYPYPSIGGGLSPFNVACAALALGALTFVAVRGARRRPWLFTGWFWYVGTLVPVIGLVQAGRQGMADRYTYVPLIGIFIAVAWAVPARIAQARYGKPLLAGLGMAVLVALAAATSLQASHWRDSRTLFAHAIEVVPDNWLANDVMGLLLVKEERFDEAERFLLASLRVNPEQDDAWNNLGIISMKRGRIEEAAGRFSRSLDILPGNGFACLNLGNIRMMQGDRRQAIAYYAQAIAKLPENPEARYNLASALSGEGRIDEAVGQYRAALALRPDYAAAHNNLGNDLLRQGKTDEAIRHLREAVRLDPADGIARGNLERALAPRN
jgi:tetratricopeptide (TPR) repeat protein